MLVPMVVLGSVLQTVLLMLKIGIVVVMLL
jgi:hypothetical protein